MNSMKLMKIMKLGISPLGILAFCLLGLIPKSQAQTFIVDNLNLANSGTEEIENSTGWYANSFTTSSGATPWQLDSLVVNMDGINDFNQKATFFAEIYSDASSAPGTSIFDLGDASASIAPSGFALFDPVTSLSLQPSTTYWLVFGDTNDDFTGPFFGLGSNDSDDENGEWTIGDAYYFSGLSDGSRHPWAEQAHGRSLLFGVRVVPEPSTYAIVGGICLVGFVAFRRIRIAKIAKSSI